MWLNAATFFGEETISSHWPSSERVRMVLAAGSRHLQPRRFLAVNLDVVVLEKTHCPVDEFLVPTMLGCGRTWSGLRAVQLVPE